MKRIFGLIALLLVSACTPNYYANTPQYSPFELAAATEEWWIQKCYDLKKSGKVDKWAKVSDCLEENLPPIYQSANIYFPDVIRPNLSEIREAHEKLDEGEINEHLAASLITASDIRYINALSVKLGNPAFAQSVSHRQIFDRNTALISQKNYQSFLTPKSNSQSSAASAYSGNWSQPVSYGGGCAENGSCYGDISSITGLPKTTHVRGYFRKDGTYVRSHYRSRRR